MRPTLRARFVIAAACAISVALGAAGIALTFIYDGNIQARALAEAGGELRTLAANVRIDDEGNLILLDEPSDPRFLAPHRGFYWQVGRGGAAELRSPSLLSFVIAWRAEPPQSNDTAIYTVPGPGERRMMLNERGVPVPAGSATATVRVAVGLDETELDDARAAFVRFAASSLIALGLALVAALWFATRISLAPLESLRTALAEVREGRRRALEGGFPDEVRPLVEDLNTLIMARDQDLLDARARAGDLAHGLKTPLAVLASTARHLREAGEAGAAAEIEGEITRINRHVSRELARARAGVRAFRRGQATAVKPVALTLAKAMATLSGDPPLRIDVEMPDRLTVAMEEGDLTEILGNLVDNARKWAESRVVVAAVDRADHKVALVVEDDGPGIRDDGLSFEIERGRRLDEQVEGSGFGLAIVKDLVEAYGGRLALSRSALGGLRVQVDLG